MDAAPELGAEHVVDEAVLSNPAEAPERGGGDDRVEVVTVAADLGASAGNPGLDSLLELVGRRRQLRGRRLTQLLWRARHVLKRSEPRSAAILLEA
jgi:hypothetical protein